jgi:uncharacterized protein YndB with AHSA1/START domain
VAFDFNKTVLINAPAKDIWGVLTIPALMNQWMSESPLNIITTWRVGDPFIITGVHYNMRFENKGLVLRFEPYKHLSYTHLSSISALPDVPESYSVLTFTLAEQERSTSLTLSITNFPTEAIYKHLAFYWNVTLEKIRMLLEED